MRRLDKALQSVTNNHRQENYVGPLSSTAGGGHNGSMNNLYNSQVRNSKVFMPYGVSSRPFSGVEAQAVVNDNNGTVIVGVYDPSRPKVGVGEICLYSSGGCSVYLSATGDISVRTNNGDIDIRQSGAIQIYNSKGSVAIDAVGNIKSTNSKGYSSIIGLYADESADGDGEDIVDGITLQAGDVKVTFDGVTGEIKILKEETTGITISEQNEITIFKDETGAVISVTEENDIKMVSNETTGIEIMHDENIKAYNSIASASISNNGKIEFKCTEFKVNDQTMSVP